MADAAVNDTTIDLGLRLPGDLSGSIPESGVSDISVSALDPSLETYSITFELDWSVDQPEIELIIDGNVVQTLTLTDSGAGSGGKVIYVADFNFSFAGAVDGLLDVSDYDLGSDISIRLTNTDTEAELDLAGLQVAAGSVVDVDGGRELEVRPLVASDLSENANALFDLEDVEVAEDETFVSLTGSEVTTGGGDITITAGNSDRQSEIIAKLAAERQNISIDVTEFDKTSLDVDALEVTEVNGEEVVDRTIESADNVMDWQFNAPVDIFAFLAEGETVTFTREIEVTIDRVLTTSKPNATLGEPDVETETTTTETITKTVSFEVVGRNEAPTATDVTLETSEDTSLTQTFVAFETADTDPDNAIVIAQDVDGSELTFTLLEAPTLGQLVDSNGNAIALSYPNYDIAGTAFNTFTYVPNQNVNGQDTFRILVTDEFGGTTTQTVTVNIEAVNDAPVNIGADLNKTAEIIPGDSIEVALGSLRLTDIEVAETDGTLTVNFDTQGGGDLVFNLPSVSPLVAGATSLTGTLDQLNAFFGGNGKMVYTDTSGTSPVISASVTDSGVAGTGGAQTTELGTITVVLNETPEAEALDVFGSGGSVIRDQLSATDAEGDALTYALDTSKAPQSGTVVIQADGSFLYQPNAGFTGTDGFDFTVTDGRSSSTESVTVQITQTDGDPSLVRVPIMLQEDALKSGKILVIDPKGREINFELVTDEPSTLGTFDLNSDGTFTYTPNENVFGEDIVYFTATPAGSSESLEFSLPIQISSVQDVPAAEPLVVAGFEDQGVTGQITATDADGEALTFAIAEGSTPLNGTVTVNPDGTFGYTPAADFYGQDSFSYTVTDGNDVSTSVVTINVAGVNDAPLIADQTVTLDEDGSVTQSLDIIDIDSADLTVTVSRAPLLGDVTINDDGTYTYTPAANANGLDSFEVTVFDGEISTTATIDLTVNAINDGPVGVSDVGFVREDRSVLLDLAGNDLDVDLGDVLRVVAAGDGAHGHVSVTEDGQVIYTPDENFFGEDTFSYTVGDGNGGTAQAEATITVKAQGEILVTGSDGNDVFNIYRNSGENRAFDGGEGYDVVRNQWGEIKLTDTSFDSIEELDANGARIRVGHDGRLDLSEVVVTNTQGIFGSHGDETIIGSQGDDIIDGYTGSDVLFGEGGNDKLIAGQWSYGDAKLSGGDGDDTLVASHGRDDLQGDAGDDVFLVKSRNGAGDAIDGGEGHDVLRNDSRGDIWLSNTTLSDVEEVDANGARIRVDRNTSLDLSGVEDMTDVREILGSSGNETIIGSQDNDFINGYSGSDVLSGGEGNDSLVAGNGYDRLNGDAGNDAFLARGSDAAGDVIDGGDGYDILQNTSRGDLWLTDATLTNVEEIDANGARIRVAHNGTLDLSGVDTVSNVREILGSYGSETFIGSAGDDRINGSDGNATDKVISAGDVQEYTVAKTGLNAAVITGDETGRDELSNIQQVEFDNYTLKLNGENNAAIGFEDQITVSEDAALTIQATQLTANDVDVDGDSFSVSSVSSEDMAISLNNGQVTLDPNGAFEALALNETRTVTASYTTVDARGAEGTGAIEVTVVGQNDGPVAVADTNETVETVAVTGSVLTNDTDVDNGAVLSVSGVAGAANNVGETVALPSGAQITILSDGSYTYDPLNAFASLGLGATTTDSVQYTVTDEHGATDTQTLTLTITGDNDAVSAGDDDYVGEGRRALFEGAINGLLSNDTDIDVGDVPFVSGAVGGVEETVFDLIDDVLQPVSRFVVTGDTGGSFAIRADGSFVFDAGTDFDDVARGETRTTSVTYVISDGNGATDEGTLTVTVGASASAPPAEPAPLDTSNMRSITVEGSFDQLGSTEVSDALSDDVLGLDLNSILDVNLFDIDTSFGLGYGSDGIDITIEDNNQASDGGSTPVLTDFGSKLQSVVDVLEDNIPNPFDYPLTSVYTGPEFDFSARIKAQLNWDVELPSMGKTAFFQPATFDFRLPDSEVEAGAQYQLYTDSMTALSPTTAVETVALGGFEVGAGYSLEDVKLKDVGYTIKTQDFFGLDIDDLVSARVGLKGEIDLTEELGVSSPIPLTGTFGFSAVDLLDGLATTGLSDFLAAIRDVQTASADERDSAGKELVAEIGRGLLAIQEVEPATFSVGDPESGEVELRASQIVERFDLSRFNDYDGFDENGVGYFVETTTSGETVHITRADLEAVMADKEISETVAEIRQLFGEDGYEVIQGLVITANLPIGNVAEIEGFETTSGDTRDTADRMGPQNIEVEEVTRLLGIEVDFREVGVGMANLAIDTAITSALLEPSPDTPRILAAGIAAKAALELAPQIDAFMEDGFRTSTSVQPVALVEAAFNPLFAVVNTIIDLVKQIPGVGSLFDNLPGGGNFSIANSDGTLAESALDSAGEFLKAALTGLAELPASVMGSLVSNPAIDGVNDALEALNAVNLDGVGKAFGSITKLLKKYKVVDTSKITDAVDSLLDIATTGVEQANDIGGAITDFIGALSGLVNSGTATIVNGIDQFVDLLMSVAKGFSVSVNAQFEKMEFTTDVNIDLVQIASFDPSDVSVTYESGGFEVESKLGEVATFVADGKPGDELDGEVTYGYSGDVDYDYRLRFDIEPILSFLQTTLDIDLTIGAGAQTTSTSFGLDKYAAIKITDDYSLDDLGSLDFTSLIDDALLELPFGVADQVRGLIFRQVQEQLSDFAADQSGLDDNEIRLFKVDDVEIATDGFSEITETFTTKISGSAPAPVVNLVFSEDAITEVAVANLLDTVQGNLASVAGDALAIGRSLEVFTGLEARLFVAKDGKTVFNANGAFEELALGESVDSEVEFTVDAPDGTAIEYTATVTIEGRNDAPVAVADEATMIEEGVLRFEPLVNDTDVDNGAVLRILSGESDFGSVSVEDGKTVVFTPNVDVFGPVTVTYIVSDEHGATGTGTITVEIEGTPDDVVATADTVVVSEDGKTTFDVTTNDIEVDGEDVTVTSFDQPTLGSLSLADDGQLVFDGNGAFEALGVGATATQTVSVTVSDPDGSSTADLTMTIEGVNDGPVGVSDVGFVREDRSVLLDLAGNDLDVDLGDVLRVVAAGDGAHGHVSVTEDGQVIYTPDENFFGEDTFSYTVGDGNGGTAQAEATITVKAQGEILVTGSDGNDVFNIYRNSGENRAFDGGEGYDVVRNQWGEIKLTDTSFDSIEELDANGARIRVGHDGRLDLSEVVVTNTQGIFGSHGDETIIGSQGDDIIDGYTGSDVLFGEGGNDKLIAGQWSYGDAKLSGGDGDDTLVASHGRDDLQGDAGDDVFLVKSRNGAGDAIDGGEGHDVLRNDSRGDIWLSNTTLSDVEEVDANGARIRVDRNTSLDLSGVEDMTDVREILGSSGNETIIGSQDNDFINGYSGSDVLSGGEGNDSLVAGNGYDRLNGDAGNDAFLARGSDAAGDVIDGGDGYDILQNTSRGDLWLTDATLTNVEEIDANGARIRVAHNGTLDLSGVDTVSNVREILGSYGSETFIGSAGDDRINGSDGNATDKVISAGDVQEYTVAKTGLNAAVITGDETGRDELSNIQQVEFDNYTLKLNGENNAAIGFEDQITVSEDAALTIQATQLTANDVDVDGDSFSVSSVSSEDMAISLNNGQVTLDPNGAFEALALNETRTVTASYTTVDARGAEGTGAIEVTVVGQNDGPVAVADTNETVETVAVTGSVLTNDTDVDNGAVLSVSGVAGAANNVGETVALPSGAQITILSDGSYTYDPLNAFASLGLGATTTDSVQYTVTDEHGATDTQTLTLTITGDNDAVSDSDEGYGMTAGTAFSANVAEGLLANASDIDSTDVLEVVGADGSAMAGSTGGQFFVNADGSFVFDAGRDFNDMQLGQSRVTTLDYTVSDGNGGTTTSTVSMTVDASSYDPFTDTEARWANFDASDEAGFDVDHGLGTFDQRKSLDVFDVLAERAVDEDLDLDTLFDIELLAVDRSLTVAMDSNSVSVSQESGEGDNGLLDTAFETAVTVLQTSLGLLQNNIGPVNVGPTVTATFGLDIDVSLDIDLVTLGEAAFFQPIEIDLQAPEFVAANEAFILRSSNVRSLTPETALETVGLESFIVNNSFDISNSSISNLGFEMETVDFAGIKLDGLASTSLTLNGEFELADAIANTKAAIASLVEDINQVHGKNLSDPLQQLSQLVNIDIEKMANGIMSGTIDLDAIRSEFSDPQEVVDKLISEANKASENAPAPIEFLGAVSDAPELYQMGQRAVLNQFDRFLEDGTGVFDLESATDSNATVAVTAAQIKTVLVQENVLERIKDAADTIQELAYAPFEGINIGFALPLENVATIAGFNPNDTDAYNQGEVTGLREIEVMQETELASVSIDFEAVAISAIEKILDSAKETPPIAALRKFVAFAKVAQESAEEGIESVFTARPAELVIASLNGMIKGINAGGNALDSFVPVDIYSDLEKISKEDGIEALDAAIDATIGNLLGPKGLGGGLDKALDGITSLAGVPELQSVLEDLKEAFNSIGISDAADSVFEAALNTANSAFNTLAGMVSL